MRAFIVVALALLAVVGPALTAPIPGPELPTTIDPQLLTQHPTFEVSAPKPEYAQEISTAHVRHLEAVASRSDHPFLTFAGAPVAWDLHTLWKPRPLRVATQPAQETPTGTKRKQPEEAEGPSKNPKSTSPKVVRKP